MIILIFVHYVSHCASIQRRFLEWGSPVFTALLLVIVFHRMVDKKIKKIEKTKFARDIDEVSLQDDFVSRHVHEDSWSFRSLLSTWQLVPMELDSQYIA